MTLRRFENRVALVAGASSGGTGAAIAQRLAAEGARVAVCARSEPGLELTMDQIDSVGGTGRAFPVDLADPRGGREQLVQWVEDAWGPVEVLVYNAADFTHAPFLDVSEDQARAAFEVNLWAPRLLMSDVLPAMLERGEGWIVNVGSVSSSLITDGPPFPPQPVVRWVSSTYGPSKAALDRLTWSVAAETYGHGVAVNVVLPIAGIATPRLGETSNEPMPVFAEAVAALCCCDSETTGQRLYSLPVLIERGEPVYDLDAGTLLEGWQPGDLPPIADSWFGWVWTDPEE